MESKPPAVPLELSRLTVLVQLNSFRSDAKLQGCFALFAITPYTEI